MSKIICLIFFIFATSCSKKSKNEDQQLASTPGFNLVAREDFNNEKLYDLTSTTDEERFEVYYCQKDVCEGSADTPLVSAESHSFYCPFSGKVDVFFRTCPYGTKCTESYHKNTIECSPPSDKELFEDLLSIQDIDRELCRVTDESLREYYNKGEMKIPSEFHCEIFSSSAMQDNINEFVYNQNLKNNPIVEKENCGRFCQSLRVAEIFAEITEEDEEKPASLALAQRPKLTKTLSVQFQNISTELQKAIGDPIREATKPPKYSSYPITSHGLETDTTVWQTEVKASNITESARVKIRQEIAEIKSIDRTNPSPDSKKRIEALEDLLNGRNVSRADLADKFFLREGITYDIDMTGSKTTDKPDIDQIIGKKTPVRYGVRYAEAIDAKVPNASGTKVYGPNDLKAYETKVVDGKLVWANDGMLYKPKVDADGNPMEKRPKGGSHMKLKDGRLPDGKAQVEMVSHRAGEVVDLSPKYKAADGSLKEIRSKTDLHLGVMHSNGKIYMGYKVRGLVQHSTVAEAIKTPDGRSTRVMSAAFTVKEVKGGKINGATAYSGHFRPGYTRGMGVEVYEGLEKELRDKGYSPPDGKSIGFIEDLEKTAKKLESIGDLEKELKKLDPGTDTYKAKEKELTKAKQGILQADADDMRRDLVAERSSRSVREVKRGNLDYQVNQRVETLERRFERLTVEGKTATIEYKRLESTLSTKKVELEKKVKKRLTIEPKWTKIAAEQRAKGVAQKWKSMIPSAKIRGGISTSGVKLKTKFGTVKIGLAEEEGEEADKTLDEHFEALLNAKSQYIDALIEKKQAE